MSGPDLYAVLGVDRDATQEQLRAAFRRRARLTHPDQGGDAVAFRAVETAYQILSDPGLRAGYDDELGATDGPPVDAATAGTGPRSARPRRPEPPPPPSRGASSHRDVSSVDFGQIRWALAFVADDGSVVMDARTARIVPGRRWWLWKLVSWALITLWALLGVWIAAERATSPVGWRELAWGSAWALTGAIVILHAARGRWSVLLVATGALGWPAYGAPEQLWSWGVYGWLAAAVAIPVLRARVGVPVWSTKSASAGNIFGEPSWQAKASAAVVEHLTVIPGVRVLHQVAGAEHAIVLDRKVALVGGPVVTATGVYSTRSWPTAISQDPPRAIDEIGAWLLRDSDPLVVDRRTLAALSRAQPRAGGRPIHG